MGGSRGKPCLEIAAGHIRQGKCYHVCCPMAYNASEGLSP